MAMFHILFYVYQRVDCTQNVAGSRFDRSVSFCQLYTMLQLTVALTSGRSESLTIPESSKVGDLKLMAQKSFGQPFLRLATAEGRVLTDPLELLQNTLEDGDQLTAIVGQGQLLATATGFALWCPGGDRVVHWGEPDSGVSYLSVQELHATNFAFAAILGDNSVVTWGARGYGGNSSGMQDQLKNLRQIKGSAGAFAAILNDGSLVTWGGQPLGADSSEVRHQLKNVREVQATESAFAAILEEGSVVTWGNPNLGGDSSAVQDQLRNVQQVCATTGAFAAIIEDGSIVTWGHPHFGGDSSSMQERLRNVQQLQTTRVAFAAILNDGSVVTWGGKNIPPPSSEVQHQLRMVQQVQGTNAAFAAILEDGRVVSWGKPRQGGDSSAVQDQLRGVQQVRATEGAFAALLSDGSIVTWGRSTARRRQLFSARSAEESGADSGHGRCICCTPIRRLRGRMGRSEKWR